MKKTIGIILLSVFVVILSASFVIAGNMYAPQIKNRMVTQQKRIDSGIAPGCLARAEVRKSRCYMNRIKAEGPGFRADCYLMKRERARVHRMPDNNSGKIYCKRYSAFGGLY